MRHWNFPLVVLALLVSARAAAQPASPPEAPVEAAPEAALTPPALVRATEPVYPPGRGGERASVVVELVLDAEGLVLDARVEGAAGADFDEAALEAVKLWEFSPARRGQTPIASRVRVSVDFAPPAFELGREAEAPAAPSPGAPAASDETSEGAQTAEASGEPLNPAAEPEFEVRADVAASRLRTEDRSASDVRVERDILDATQRRHAADLLSTAPGFFVARPEGGAVAHGIMLRGFDAEHGQDLELSFGGIPINQPSHLHGQGYADLGFLIPEVVQSLRVMEGPYDPRQGDFAVAGSADFELGVEERGLRYETSAGSFRTFRQLAIWAPRDEEVDTFAAAVYEQSAGFGSGRAGRSGAIMVQQAFGDRPFRFRLLGSFHAARAGLAGALRSDDVRAGTVGFYGVYDDPSAEAQGAASMRAQLALLGERRGPKGQNSEFSAWILAQTFRIAENYTGYTRRLDSDPTVAPGDLMEAQNRNFALGLSARHRSEELSAFGFLRGHLELGATGRADFIDQAQGLLELPSHATWDKLISAKTLAMDVGVYADVDLSLGERVALRGGVRADLLAYEVDDRLGDPDAGVPSARRDAMGVAVGPRVTLDVEAHEQLHIIAAYGEGFRSPAALSLVDGERAPFTKVRSADLGARYVLGAPLELSVSGFYTRLSDDAVFDPEEARLERVGATQRLGVTASAVSRPLPWLVGSASLTYVKATLLEAPDEPEAGYRDGQPLPFVPPWVGRLDLGAHHELAELKRSRLEGQLGAGLQLVGRRPLLFDQVSSRFALLDLSAGLRFAFVGGRAVAVGLEADNVAGARYAAAEYFFASNWDPSVAPSETPARHFVAGAPRSILVTLGLTL